jgi:glycosyltransferase involved in cell wall biosynthesis
VPQTILHLIPNLAWGGAQQQLCRLAQALPAHDWRTHVVVLDAAGREQQGPTCGAEVTCVGRRGAYDAQAFVRLCRLADELRPAAIHTWRAAAHVWGFAAARYCGVRRFVMTQHRIESGRGASGEWLLRRIAGKADAVVVNSESDRAELARRGWPAERLRAIANGVPPADPPATTRRQLLAELGLPDHCRLVACIGNLCERKRLKDAIWAADLLKVIRDDVHLLIVGAGPHFDRLRIFRDQVVIRDKVHFLGQRNDVPRLLPHVDVLWSASACEGHCAAILEAMAAGVPVVATDVPGTRELVVAGETGFLVPVGNRAGFARWTNELLDDRGLAERQSAAARQRAATAFSAAAMAQRYAALYAGLLA